MTTPELVLAILFWLSVGTVVYAYLGYPLVIWTLSKLFGRSPIPPASPEEWPHVSLLVAAYNEEAEIAKRIENALQMDYPRDRLEIVIASDGSDDRTVEIARQYSDRGVTLFNYPERRGKPTVLNRSVPRLTGDIIALSDANSFTEPSALKNLVRWFSDPQVGAVCGKVELIDSETGLNVDGLYWKYETFLKKCDSKLGALLGSNGAIYALRRAWYPVIPDNTIVDDFVIPLRVKLLNRCKIIYDNEAVAHEETASTMAAEFHRRSRIGAGGFQAITLLSRLLHPKYGWTAFTFLSHKILRWICPFLMILAIISNIALLHLPLYQITFAAQLGFYVIAVLGAYLPARPSIFKLFRLATMFVSMNAALLVGFFRWLLGTQRATWQRTPRLAETVEALQ